MGMTCRAHNPATSDSSIHLRTLRDALFFRADALHLRLGVRRRAQLGADRPAPKFPRLQARGDGRIVQV